MTEVTAAVPAPAPAAPVAGAPAPPPVAGAPAPVAGDPPKAPDGPLASFWDKDKGALDLAKLGTAFAERDTVFTQNAERMKAVPEKPEAYKPEPILPEGVVLPQGAQLKFDDKAVAQAAGIAHQLGVPQEAFSKLLGVVAAHQIGQAQAAVAEHQAMVAAENKKLGEGGPQRRSAIDAFVQANEFTAEEQSEIALLKSTEAGVRALERFMAKANGSAVPGSRTDTPAPKPSEKPMETRWYGDKTQRKG